MPKRKKKTVNICVVEGVGGLSLVIGVYRVVGPKPWGGGKVIKRWNKVPVKDIKTALED